jgi:DNA-binding FrmR family transcriptional regulator
VQLPDEVVDDLRKRLRRAGGQVQAVENMLAEGRECRDVVTQRHCCIERELAWDRWGSCLGRE